MPKIVDHAQRRDEIALVACQVVADHGFEQATVARIARAAGYTTGMVAHYYDSKQDIILAALRLILKRIEERLTRERDGGEANLLSVLSEAIAIDAQRFTESAFWLAFWGQMSADPKLKRLNVWVHREYMRLFERCFSKYWPEWTSRPAAVRDQVLRSLVTCMNGLTAGAVTSPRDWPAARQVEHLKLQLDLLRRWAARKGGSARKRSRA
ncbi:MAG TPA: TetR family transcriptional regulator C-terminal domain-containing protein [Steroidobacteraceae bacterium]|jgi:AcrR family transcriptional regulator|nr:TetR family transcriptional regulator C-terminal domain-containing protein [Steroidobacteraceae bacterium]